jgi:hypothetical protein
MRENVLIVIGAVLLAFLIVWAVLHWGLYLWQSLLL